MSNLKLSILVLFTAFFSSHTLAYDAKSGGGTTVQKEGANAYSLPAGNLPLSKRLDFSVGNSFFRNPWVQAPASTDARDGLGPLFNTNGCQNCHIKDGRGHPPEADDLHAVSMLVRLSIPAKTPQQKRYYLQHGVLPEPVYGAQLQDFALPNQLSEGKIKITYTDQLVEFTDGTQVILRKPDVEIVELQYGPMHSEVQLSARVAPAMIGLGLLESIPEATIKSWAEEQSQIDDGISGKVNHVWDVQEGKYSLGRFGWKAGQPNLLQQSAAAFNGDIGLTSRLFMQENCTKSQSLCNDLPNGGKPEVSDNILKFVEFYTQHLGVPTRRNIKDAQVQKGQQIFAEIGCESCHKSNVKTGYREGLPALTNQTIHPYTDLLLHDMGEGLADNRPEFLANGQEWRTPPLWGIGYTKEVSGHTYFLHDGRARNLMEAILWHGGEAEASKEAFRTMSVSDRNKLITFLKSL